MSSSHSKRYQAAREKVEAERAYPVDEALALEEAGYVLVRAVQTDDDLIVSAPIWLNP